MSVCERPPEGWYCTREPEHDGPCAAREIVGEGVAVMAIKPFWRWAIIPVDIGQDLPAIPFWTRKGAEARAAEYLAERDLYPHGIALLRKRRFGHFEIEAVLPKP